MTDDGILVVSEDACRELVGRKDAFDAVEAVFAAMARGDAYNFPVIREAIGYADALYGFKSGFDRAELAKYLTDEELAEFDALAQDALAEEADN